MLTSKQFNITLLSKDLNRVEDHEGMYISSLSPPNLVTFMDDTMRGDTETRLTSSNSVLSCHCSRAGHADIAASMPTLTGNLRLPAT